jgi:hypothetical protein
MQGGHTFSFFVRKASLGIIDSALDSGDGVLLCSFRVAIGYECD